MHKSFLIALRKFTTGREEDREFFIQKALGVCKTFKANCLARPNLDVFHQRRQRTISSTSTCEKKKELKGATDCQESAITLKE